MSVATEPMWLFKPSVLAIHGLLLAEHGGATGLRDERLLESALAGPINRFQDGETDLHQLAASYAYGLTSNDPFIDDNKPTAFAAAGAFLELNGSQLIASESDAVNAVLALTNGELNCEEFGNWMKISSIESGQK